MLTKKQRKNLNLAIDRARGPGACSYVIDDEPGCVIGQLAAIEGVSVNQLNTWGTQTVKYLCDKNELPEPLTRYPNVLLRQVQKVWDRWYNQLTDNLTNLPALTDANIAELRDQMHSIVAEH